MHTGDQVFSEWAQKVEPRISLIRSAYFAAAVLGEMLQDAELIESDWKQKLDDPAYKEMKSLTQVEYDQATQVAQSYRDAYRVMSDQMELVNNELSKLRNERLTLAGMCLSLNIQELGAETLESVYQTIGPDTPVDHSIAAARAAVERLSDEAKARQELADFLHAA